MINIFGYILLSTALMWWLSVSDWSIYYPRFTATASVGFGTFLLIIFVLLSRLAAGITTTFIILSIVLRISFVSSIWISQALFVHYLIGPVPTDERIYKPYFFLQDIGNSVTVVLFYIDLLMLIFTSVKTIRMRTHTQGA
jgi:hypothetical protein